MELPLAKQLREAHEKELARIGDDLNALIDYVVRNEGFEYIDLNKLTDPLNARIAATGQNPDYDMILWVLQNNDQFWPVPDFDDADCYEQEEYQQECPHCGL